MLKRQNPNLLQSCIISDASVSLFRFYRAKQCWRGLEDRNSVRLSVTRVRCDEIEEHTVEILTPHKRVFNLVFWYQKRLMGDVPFYLKFALKVTHFPLKNADSDQYLLITSQPYRASEKRSIIAHRKSTTRFQTSYRWSAYVIHNSPKGWLKNEFSLKSATKFLCVKTARGKVVAKLFNYSMVYRCWRQ